jgi:DivIVA domain-containing protein
MTQGSEAGATGAPGARISPLDIQQKEFRVSRFGGYRMRDVDEFLDQLTEVVSGLVEENGRLRRQAGAAPVVGSPDLDDVARQADEIIQRARDEAARIAADARAASAAAGTPAAETDQDRAAVKAFLQQERAFLQELAGIVQDHAETVKGMARGARAQETRASTAPVAAPTEEAASTPAEDPTEDAGSPTEDVADDGEDRGDRLVEIADADATQTLPRSDDRTELAQTRPGGQERSAEGDASLRDLFWGEDG